MEFRSGCEPAIRPAGMALLVPYFVYSRSCQSNEPEFQPSWGDQPHVTTLTLTRLSGRNGAMMVTALAGEKELARDVIDEIVERTDRVPLFVEELTQSCSRKRRSGGSASLGFGGKPGVLARRSRDLARLADLAPRPARGRCQRGRADRRCPWARVQL